MSLKEPCCSDVCRSLCALVDEELEASQAVALQMHIDHCEQCATRVAFAKSSRSSVRSAVKSVRTPEALRSRLTAAVQQACEAENDTDVVHKSSWFSWKLAAPLAGAAALVVVWAGIATWKGDAPGQAAADTQKESQASMVPVDTLVDTLVQQHANPLPPETTNPKDFAAFDRFVGVPVRMMPQASWQSRCQLLGARMIPLQDLRAAMFQYVMGNGGRVSVYVYNPQMVRRSPSHRLRQARIENEGIPVYVGYVRGYSVAVTSRRGVGYAMASDLDETENSKMLLAVGEH